MTNSQSVNETEGTGFLCVQITTASGAIPVPDASVTVRIGSYPDIATDERAQQTAAGSVSDGKNVNAEDALDAVEKRNVLHLTSNQNGQTETVSLPAPLRVISLSPGLAPTFSTCDIEVVKEGYYRSFYHNVPIYDTVTSLQPVYLIPLSEKGAQNPFGEDERIFPLSMNPALSSENKGKEVKK